MLDLLGYKRFDLILFDPIYKFSGDAKENANEEMASVMSSLETVAVRTGAAIAFAAHYSKGNQAGKDSLDRMSGAGVLARDPDSLVMLTKHAQDNCFSVESTLRNFPQVEPFVVRWQFPLMRLDSSLDAADLKQPGGRPRSHDPETLLSAIVDSSVNNPVSVSQWAIAAGVSRQTLQTYLPELREQGLISTVGDGNSARKFITPKGKKLVHGAQI